MDVTLKTPMFSQLVAGAAPLPAAVLLLLLPGLGCCFQPLLTLIVISGVKTQVTCHLMFPGPEQEAGVAGGHQLGAEGQGTKSFFHCLLSISH